MGLGGRSSKGQRLSRITHATPSSSQQSSGIINSSQVAIYDDDLDVQLEGESEIESDMSDSVNHSPEYGARSDGLDRQKNLIHKTNRSANRHPIDTLATANSAVSLIPDDFDQPMGILEELLLE
jgi:hypothetical protein